MKNSSRTLITVLIALAFAAGMAGSGCKRARHVSSAGEDLTQGAHAITGGVEHQASQGVSSDDLAHLARKDLKEGAQGGETAATRQLPRETAQARPEMPMCYVESFHHKPTPGDSDEESSSHHKNLMTLAHSGVNPAHICVRVNGIPVKFSHKAEHAGDQILIGAIAGPSAKITVSYCVGKLVCPEVSRKDCTVPKDQFMDALSGGEDNDDDQAVQWQGSQGQTTADTKLNAQVKKELSDIDGMNNPDGQAARGPASMPVFKGWIEDQSAPACPKQAS